MAAGGKPEMVQVNTPDTKQRAPVSGGGALVHPAGTEQIKYGTGADTPPLQLSQRSAEELDDITHLLYFASQGDVNGLRSMIEASADVNASDYDGRTAMHLAASEGKSDVVKLLINSGANVNPVDRWGSTPLADSQHYGYAEVGRLLKAAGGKVPKGNGRLASPQSSLALTSDGDFEIDVSELDFSKSVLVGKGAFGEIRLAQWCGTNVAVKTIISQLSQQPQVEREFRAELSLLQQLRHPNIVQFLGAVTKTQPPMLVTEYLTRGDLHEILKRKGALAPKEAIRYALDIARGMSYLHQHKPEAIVHRDLKPRNLLRDEAGHLKVADFGLSRLLKTQTTERLHELYHMTGEAGSYRYMAPEVYRHEAYAKSVDVYSFAIIVHEMFEGGPAFKLETAEDVAEKFAFEHQRPPFRAKTYPPGMTELIAQSWHKAPHKRPTFQEILVRLEEIEVRMGSPSALEGPIEFPGAVSESVKAPQSPHYKQPEDEQSGCSCAIL